MSKSKKIGLLLTSIVLFLIIWNQELLRYGIMQLRGQVKVVAAARPVEEILEEGNLPDSIRTKLILIQEIRAFAFDSLGLHYSDNYTTFADQKDTDTLWVLTAAQPFDMEAFEWKFPFLGSVSYKGFFKKEAGLKEELSLKKEGLDTDLGIAGGWSTLGWFTDPILSGMLRRNYGDLANLIIHELTHQTLYVRDSVEFNENLASFVGDKGARLFLKSKFGPDSGYLQEYELNLYDDSLYTSFMVEACKRLEALYMGMDDDLLVSQKRRRKDSLIGTILKEVENLPLHNPQPFIRSAQRAQESGNAYFLSFQRYGGDQLQMQHELDSLFQGDLRKYIAWLAQRYPHL